MSGLTSQPNLGSIAAALQGSARDPGLDLAAMQALSHYWEGVRRGYAPFEADMRARSEERRVGKECKYWWAQYH